MKTTILLFCTLLVAGCASMPEQPPAISDISKADSTVRVQAQAFGSQLSPKFPSVEKVKREGQVGCDQFGMSAVMLSHRCTGWVADGWGGHHCMMREYLFACKSID